LSAIQYTEEKADEQTAKQVAMAMKRNLEIYKYSNDKTILTYDELGNLYNMASYFNELEAIVKQTNIKLENINISDFYPNKLINLHFVDQHKDIRLGGVYHINNLINVFVPINMASTKEMRCASNLSLSRRNV
jgi:hypothetical protein